MEEEQTVIIIKSDYVVSLKKRKIRFFFEDAPGSY